MASERIEDNPGTVQRIALLVDGEPYTAYPGDTVAAALYAAGRRAWRRARSEDARGLLCGMGICFDCLVTVDGAAGKRACQVLVREGMAIDTGLAGGERE
jgi:predicted molibdopterin-dependent oxidoreductase YjgC